MMKTAHYLFLTIVVIAATVGSNVSQPKARKTDAQPVNNSQMQGERETLSPEQKDLLEAETRNQQAQADYYAKQNAKLDKETSGKSVFARFWSGLSDNPAGILGLVGAILALVGASLAARVSYLAFYFNYHATTKNQLDNQFFSALERFGSVDSAAIRSSAAGTLALMGQRKVKELVKAKPGFFTRSADLFSEEQPYLETALNQLISGLMVEEESPALLSIQTALAKLCTLNKPASLSGLKVANEQLQKTLVVALAEFFAAGSVVKREEVTDAMWRVASSLADYQAAELRSLVERFDKQVSHHVETQSSRDTGSDIKFIKNARPVRFFTNRFSNSRTIFEGMSAEKRADHQIRVASALESAAARMHVSARLIMTNEPATSDFLNGSDDLFLPTSDNLGSA